jgi:uncharacterized protein
MRSYERNGVHIEQCSDCRGLFLDRGELERLVEAEGSFYKESPSPSSSPRHEEHGSYSHGGKQYKKRRKNFLEELFD